jgi:hypothetical protein
MSNLPSATEKPSLLDWLETFLPFRLPRIPFVRTAANLDKAAAMIVLAGGENVAARIQSSTSSISARTDAERALIEFGKTQITADARKDIAARALEYAVGDALRKQENRENILRLATEELAKNPPSEEAETEIEDDWLNAFRQYAETKSKSDLQQLWAKILAAEIRKPGSSSLRTLDFLSTISSDDANRIVQGFSFVIKEGFIPYFAYEQDFLDYGRLLFLQEMGIVAGLYGLGGSAWRGEAHAQQGWNPPNVVQISYYDKMAAIQSPDAQYKIEVPAAILTSIGRELFQITETKSPNYDYFRAFILGLEKAGIKRITIADILARKSGGKLGLGNHSTIFES